MNLVFIVNEQAGSGKARQVWLKQRQQLSIAHELHYTEYEGHAIEIARSYTKCTAQKILLVAVGGDGTIHEVAEGAAGFEHIVIGALKAGSGNDFARGYQAFRSVHHIEQYLRKSSDEYETMDLGLVNWQDKKASFINNTGFGFDAYITTAVNSSKLKKVLNAVKLGKLSYLLITIKGLFRFKRFNATVFANGKEHKFVDVWFIAVCNQPYFGGGMKISPRSNTKDNKLELTVVHQLSRLKLLTVFLTVFWGKHENFKEVTMLQGESFMVKLDASVPAHVDGESLGNMKPQEMIHCAIDDRKWKIAGGKDI